MVYSIKLTDQPSIQKIKRKGKKRKHIHIKDHLFVYISSINFFHMGAEGKITIK